MPTQEEPPPSEPPAIDRAPLPRVRRRLSIGRAVVGATLASLLAAGIGLWWLDSTLAGAVAAVWPAERRQAVGLVLLLQAVAGALALWMVLAWRVVEPLRRLKKQASEIARSGQGGGPRIDWDGNDNELGAVGRHLNRAIDRIDDLLEALEGRHAELHRQAMVDALTGLPNRRLFAELFTHAASVARRGQQPLALLFIDLDRFKQVNDTLGHRAGDELLRVLGQRMRTVMRGSDLVGRLAGDEFVALLSEVEDAQAVAHAALRLIHAIEQPVPLPGQPDVQMQVSASIGIARFPADGRRFDELLQRADQAMYRAKAAGRGRFALYRAQDDAPEPVTGGGDPELAQALARHALQLHYQPLIDTRVGRAVGAEALLRWQHPQQGVLTPVHFIHRAGAGEQLQAITRHVLHAACAQQARWKAAGLAVGPVAVNVSAAEFRHEQLPASVGRALHEHGLVPGDLALELCSHMVMSDPEFSLLRAAELRREGAELVLENVGTAPLSLALLAQLQPARLKIEAGLVAGLPHDAAAVAAVRGVVHLAQGMGVGVLAVGVETELQRAALERAGCPVQQGFLHGRPAPAVAEPAWALSAADAPPAAQRARASASSPDRAH
ncbi:putative bifunctional diguanylate cyclase/phosphodiesterase [Ideonella sp.]|uniref:putative bifunctional diguanylate cyclase/phosphodiesterase n=1 Tax=Ideonella sp. TaxID=1929293 RepID=UPI0035B36AC2